MFEEEEDSDGGAAEEDGAREGGSGRGVGDVGIEVEEANAWRLAREDGGRFDGDGVEGVGALLGKGGGESAEPGGEWGEGLKEGG